MRLEEMSRDELIEELRAMQEMARLRELDIAERARAEAALRAAEARLRAMVAAMPDLLFRLDREARYLDVAAADPSRLALPPEAFLGKTIAEAFESASPAGGEQFGDVRSFVRASTEAVRRALETGELQRFEYRFREQYFEARIVRSGPEEVLAIASDITERRHTEELLRAAVASRDDLLAVVSHDLRSPLMAIQLSAVSLSRTPPGGERPASRKHLDLILRSAERMGRLIEDLLQASTIEAGRFTVTPAPQDALPLVEEALHAIEPIAATRSIRLHREVAPGLPALRCDRVRVIQVLSNLLGNAVKFVPERGNIQVRAWAEEGHGHVHFAVCDDGPGISEDQVPRIFDRYWKGRAAGRQGVGLGLFIARGIVEAHGGRIRVESRAGKGCCFDFTIPRA